VSLNGALISGNFAAIGSEVARSSGTITANSFNLFGHSGLTNTQAFLDFTPSGTDITATSDGTTPTALASILNAALGNNGGLTQTHALVTGSPAIDAVTTSCPPPDKDQRGVPRPQDGNNDSVARCDIGAFERVRPGTTTCDGLPVTKQGTSAGETLNGTASADVIQGLGGSDIVKGLGGNDVLCGGAGNDQVLGGAGGDRLFGEAETDSLNGEAGFDRCNGGTPTTDTAASCEVQTGIP
jgi:hypothetical protein